MSKSKDKSDQKPAKYTPTIQNKKARFNYNLLEKLEAGIVLVGTEVKSLRNGKASLEEAYCRLRGDELYLIGCNIALYEHGNLANHEPLRPRKLLVHRRELKKIESKLTQKGLTMVPLRIYFSHGLAKVEIALAQGKKFGDKRSKLKERQMDRDVKRVMKRRWK